MIARWQSDLENTKEAYFLFAIKLIKRAICKKGYSSLSLSSVCVTTSIALQRQMQLYFCNVV